jgi:hypothetical protein
MLVSRMRRIRTVWRAPVVFRACVFDGLVNHLLEFVRGNVGESYAGLADGLMKDAQRTASSMNFERSRFPHALGTQKGTQGMIGLFRPGNG